MSQSSPSLVDQALASMRAGRPAEARDLAQAATRAEPLSHRAWAALGTVCLMTGEATAARDHLGRAVELEPSFAEGHLNLSMAALAAGDVDMSWKALTSAITLAPELDGRVALGRLREAAKARFDKDGEGGALLVSVLIACRESDLAIGVCRSMVASHPRDVDAWALLGETMARVGQFDEAIRAVEECRKLAPDDPNHAVNLAGIALARGRIEEALDLGRCAAESFPGHCRPAFFVADTLEEVGRKHDAAPWFARAAGAGDADAASLARCWIEAADGVDWDLDDQILPRLLSALDQGQTANPFHLLMAPVPPQMLKANAVRYCRAKWPLRRSLRGTAVPPEGKLRIGYLSPDYRDHPIAHLIKDLFANHDRDRFQVMLYGLGPEEGGDVGRSVRALADGCVWLDKMSAYEGARRIRDDGIHVLVDLAGHTRDGRPEILSFRPAPLQMHYLGYPGTTGASFVDYLVGDPWTTPAAHESHFSEAVIRLPTSYQINSIRPEVKRERARWGLPEDGMVYCSFNQIRKLTRPVFGVWCRILARVPGSLLWLLTDGDAQEVRLRAEAMGNGIDPTRLVFARRTSRAMHLQRLAAGDLHLDSLPYNAHTTCTDAIWAGCPLITTPGETFAARVSAGLLSAMGLEDCIAPTPEAFVDMGVRLGTDPDARNALRARILAARQSPVFDPCLFTTLFEQGLLAAWARAVSGLAPASLDISMP